ncbi:MAG: O-antigen ligase family protein [Leptothrix ochracea]|uniref:O-antigen ligase family protein n=1 Tax=Leptothrix ochracea TaxID=735331 RepID=UPI0034E22398
MSFALYLLYVFMTFFRPVEMYAPDLASLRPMLTLSMVCLFLSWRNVRAGSPIAARNIHFKLFFGFCTMISLSQIANDGGPNGALQAINEFTPSIMLFVLTVLNVNTLDRLQKTCLATIIGLVIAAGYGISAFHTGERWTDLVMIQKHPDHDLDDMSKAPPFDAPANDDSGWYVFRVRSLGPLSDPNDFAQAMVMALPMLMGLYRKGQLLRNLMLIAAPGGVLFYAIKLTQSRGAQLGIGAALLVGSLKMFGLKKTLIGAVVMGVLVSAGSIGGTKREISGKDKSSEDRILSWSSGVDMLGNNPIFGVGYGNFEDNNPVDHLTAHNSFVLCFAELGLSGYFIWMGLIALTLKCVTSCTRPPNPPNTEVSQMAVLLLAAMAGFFTCGWFLSRTYQSTLYFLLALCIACWHISETQRDEETAPKSAELLPPTSNPAMEDKRLSWRLGALIGMAITFAVVEGFIINQQMSPSE